MGQLEARFIGRWTMFRNLIIKHDPRVRPYHPSSTRNETRHDIVERGARKGILDRKEKEMSWGISTLHCHYVILYLCRMCELYRNTSHYMTYGLWWARCYTTRSQKEIEVERETEQINPLVFVYASIHLETENDRTVGRRYRAALELIAKRCVRHQTKCHQDPVVASWWTRSRYRLDICRSIPRSFHGSLLHDMKLSITRICIFYPSQNTAFTIILWYYHLRITIITNV